jgi:hypothetical protein
VSCAWCGRPVGQDDGFRLVEHPGNRGAAFCRLEHVVPWAMRGAQWEAGEALERSGLDELRECSHCGRLLDESQLRLVRHRRVSGQLHRIPDGFCSVEHLLEWAKAGGRWRS